MTSTMGQREIVVCHDSAALAAEAVRRIVAASQEAISRRRRFTLVLAGGSTPERTYQLLAQPDQRTRLDWSRTWVFMGDERCVPFDDVRSNYGMAARTLLKPAQVDSSRVLPMPTDVGSPAQCAEAYEERLREFFEMPEGQSGGGLPQFDLILLGMGDDGHTASLFPGKPTLKETKAWVTWSPPGTLPPPVDRVTLTFPVLNAAGQVMFLVSGAKKASSVQAILEGDAPVEKHPAAGVQPTEGKLVWLLDEEAAQWLKKK